MLVFGCHPYLIGLSSMLQWSPRFLVCHMIWNMGWVLVFVLIVFCAVILDHGICVWVAGGSVGEVVILTLLVGYVGGIVHGMCCVCKGSG